MSDTDQAPIEKARQALDDTRQSFLAMTVLDHNSQV